MAPLSHNQFTHDHMLTIIGNSFATDPRQNLAAWHLILQFVT
jgi:hypothetical protein